MVWLLKYAGIFSQRARIWWLSSRSGVLGRPTLLPPSPLPNSGGGLWWSLIRMEERNYSYTPEIWTSADWLHNPSNHAKPQLSSDGAPRRSAASSAARHPSTNKACCCLPHTWTLRPDRRIWTRRQTSPSACFGSSALVANSSNRAPSVGRSRQATLKSHLFPDAAAISSYAPEVCHHHNEAEAVSTGSDLGQAHLCSRELEEVGFIFILSWHFVCFYDMATFTTTRLIAMLSAWSRWELSIARH